MKRKMYLLRLVLLVVVLACAGCAPASGDTVNTPAGAAPASTESASPATVTPTLTEPVSPVPVTPTLSEPTPGPTTAATNSPTTGANMPPQNSNQAAQQLVQALELALGEMRAAGSSETAEQLRTHTQTALSVLVGMYGRWYSGRGQDPSGGLGVLPGEIQPQGGADGGGSPQPTAGLALLTMGTSAVPSPELFTILGDVKLWQSNPRAGYDSIANAVNTADTAQMQLGKLEGSVPRAVAWQRLVLTQASDPETAQNLSAQATAELESALAAAKTIAK